MSAGFVLGMLLLALLPSVVITIWFRYEVARKLRTISSVLSALREGDFSIRARSPRSGDPFSGVLAELNALGASLREQRLSKIESWALLRKMLAELDVVVLAFDEQARLRLCNDAAASVLGGVTATALLGKHAEELAVGDVLRGDAARVLNECAALGGGAWDLRRSSFRLAGEPHTLVVLSDLSGVLRTQERQAWKRLTAVLGHEINNSLAPIQSISEALLATLADVAPGQRWEREVIDGLTTVNRRSRALARFTSSYAKLWRLPPPKLAPIDVEECVQKAARVEQRLPVSVLGGPKATVLADADQVEQLLINLLKNAIEASRERATDVRVRWSVTGRKLELIVEDDGPGPPPSENSFVPFFTTKPNGSGIGLALSRQIAEAHGGDLQLRARRDAVGAQAVLRLPLR